MGVPIAFFCTYGRNAETYSEFVKYVYEATKCQWKPKGFMADFEKAIWNGVHLVFPECVPLGCYFHFKQCIHRHLVRFSINSTIIGDIETDVHDLYSQKTSDTFWNSWNSFKSKWKQQRDFIQYMIDTWIGTDTKSSL
jgi:hypothetical protein